MKKTSILISAICMFLTSCTQRGCQTIEREMQFSERHYCITVFSGGKSVAVYKFTGIVNQEEESDGIYFFMEDKLVEISGDYIIESFDKQKSEYYFSDTTVVM